LHFLNFFVKNIDISWIGCYFGIMEQVTKAIRMEKWMADTIQKIANQERRSFAREAQVLLERALRNTPEAAVFWGTVQPGE
jgi:hypothetical protein